MKSCITMRHIFSGKKKSWKICLSWMQLATKN
uniref:Uncharacterized protein n=1 Tax=Rhizophora mucronata TaxID=61149 RepID=A0A2P2QF02_RHIMU